MSGQLQLLGIYHQRLLMKESFQSGAEINSSNYGEVTWNKDGTKLFILDSAAEDITEYSVSTPFSLANVDQTKSAESISSVSSIRTGQSGEEWNIGFN